MVFKSQRTVQETSNITNSERLGDRLLNSCKELKSAAFSLREEKKAKTMKDLGAMS